MKRLLVTGGIGAGSVKLDSTEIFDPDLERWSAGAVLPVPMRHHRAASLDSRILIFGIDIYCEHKVTTILQCVKLRF